MNTVHKTVLLKETIDLLQIKKGDVLVDATVNSGGHSLEAFKREPNIKVLAIDADFDALVRSNNTLKDFSKSVTMVLGNFRDIEKILIDSGIPKADKFVFDLGLSSDQLDVSGRGFSFKKSEPLLMTFNKKPGQSDLTASDVVNEFSEENLESVIRGFGEEKFSKKIAKAIVTYRLTKKIETTNELAELVKASVPSWYRRGKIHPATKTFQAIRMTVNNELPTIEQGLAGAWKLLRKGGRIAVISFHSLEDRIIKRFFKEKVLAEQGILINKKPIIPSPSEIAKNSRSRSAKLRVIEKIK